MFLVVLVVNLLVVASPLKSAWDIENLMLCGRYAFPVFKNHFGCNVAIHSISQITSDALCLKPMLVLTCLVLSRCSFWWQCRHTICIKLESVKSFHPAALCTTPSAHERTVVATTHLWIVRSVCVWNNGRHVVNQTNKL